MLLRMLYKQWLGGVFRIYYNEVQNPRRYLISTLHNRSHIQLFDRFGHIASVVLGSVIITVSMENTLALGFSRYNVAILYIFNVYELQST